MSRESGGVGNDRGTVITVGTFDGVHLGHRQVLETITRRAREADHKSVLVTFEPHPLEVVNLQAAPMLLTVGHERREILAQSELDMVVFLEFTRELSQYTPEDFVRMLLDRFNLKEYHDQFLAAGMIPISLIRWEMTGLEDEVRQFWGEAGD